MIPAIFKTFKYHVLDTQIDNATLHVTYNIIHNSELASKYMSLNPIMFKMYLNVIEFFTRIINMKSKYDVQNVISFPRMCWYDIRLWYYIQGSQYVPIFIDLLNVKNPILFVLPCVLNGDIIIQA